VLDPVRVEVLHLNLVVVKQPPKEGIRGHRKPTLMKAREGDDVSIEQC
jgi:hypothetical protein